MRRPGIELSLMLVMWFRGQWLEVITPGPIETSWQRWILPLNHRRFVYRFSHKIIYSSSTRSNLPRHPVYYTLRADCTAR